MRKPFVGAPVVFWRHDPTPPRVDSTGTKVHIDIDEFGVAATAALITAVDEAKGQVTLVTFPPCEPPGRVTCAIDPCPKTPRRWSWPGE